LKIRSVFFLGILIIQHTYTSWLPAWLSSTNLATKSQPTLQYSFKTWKKACESLPAYIPDSVRAQKPFNQTVLTPQELTNALTVYFDTLLTDKELFLNKLHWVDQILPDKLINSLQQDNSTPIFDPFVEKIVLNPKSIVAFHGDIQGDVHSLLAFITHLQQKKFIKDFEIIHPDFYMIFLGDYTDRGLYGPEVIYTILRLKAANPHNVFLARGNHEEREQNKDDKRSDNYHECFWSQLEVIFDKQNAEQLFEKINKLYESLPLAIYLGCRNQNQTDYILCCHGGIEIGFDPYFLLNHYHNHAFTKLGELKRLNQLKKIEFNESILNLFKNENRTIKTFENLQFTLINANNLQSNVFLQNFNPNNIVSIQYSPLHQQYIGLFIGFQWNDYEINSSCERAFQPSFIRQTRGRGFVIGKTFNNAILQLHSDKNNKVHGVFRAHQHRAYNKDPMMQRILNKDNQDFYINRGVGRLWILDEPKKTYPYQLWDNIVCTFNVSPNTIYQLAGYQEDTYGLLTLMENYKNWRLDIINQKTIK